MRKTEWSRQTPGVRQERETALRSLVWLSTPVGGRVALRTNWYCKQTGRKKKGTSATVGSCLTGQGGHSELRVIGAVLFCVYFIFLLCCVGVLVNVGL